MVIDKISRRGSFGFFIICFFCLFLGFYYYQTEKLTSGVRPEQLILELRKINSVVGRFSQTMPADVEFQYAEGSGNIRKLKYSVSGFSPSGGKEIYLVTFKLIGLSDLKVIRVESTAAFKQNNIIYDSAGK
jgi:hypothetical protein